MLLTEKIKNKKKLLLIFVLACLARFSYVALVPPRPMEWDDSRSWNFVAVKFFNGEGFLHNTEGMDPRRPPIYPLFLAAVYKLFGLENFSAVKFSQALIGAISCLLIYQIAALLFSPPVAFWSGLAMAIWPPLIVYSEILVSETLFILLFYSFLLVWILAYHRSQKSFYLLAGFLVGILNLCRGVLLFFPALLLVIIPYLKKLRNESVQNYLTLVCLSLLVIAAWTGRNYKVYGGFVPTEGAEQFWSGTLPWEEQRLFWDSELMKRIQGMNVTLAERNRIFLKDALERIAASPWNYFKLTVRKFFFFWFQPVGQKLTERRFPFIGQLLYVGQVFLVLLFFVGVLRTTKYWKNLLPIYLLIGYMSALHILLAPEPRYRLPLEPLFLMFAIQVILQTLRSFSNLRSPLQKESI